MYRIGIDVGGTFTDFALSNADGLVAIAKSPSTPEDQSEGVLVGLEILAREQGLALGELLARTVQVIHGTTAATNALLERRGAKVGLLTTRGHRDILEQREGLKPERYNLRLRPAPVLVPRERRIGIAERIRFDGSVELPLDEAALRREILALKDAGLDAIAICFLHAYRNPEHEIAAKRIVGEVMPDAYVSISSEVLPQIKEYERLSTTVVNSFVGKELSRYLGNLQSRLQGAGYGGEILVMHSHGGVGTIADSVALAAGCVLSGPAGGIAGARFMAELSGVGDLVSFDMGGTSTDISVLEGGAVPLSSNRDVDNIKVALPSIDIHTIGSGGGSIASVEAGGILHVGPASAGATPGPACYGKGGVKPTVTDANVVLGYYDGKKFLGGRTAFDPDAAHDAMRSIADGLNCSIVEAAEGVQRVVNTQMAEGVRVMAVRRGVDLRRYTLLSFGGAAGLHIADIARLLQIRRVMVPRVASVLSAWGMLATDLRYELSRSHMSNVRELKPDMLRELFDAMERDGRDKLGSRLEESVQIVRSLEMRYGEQIFEIKVSLEGIDLASPALLADIATRFHERHQELYGYHSPDQEIVLVNLCVTAIGKLDGRPTETVRTDGAVMRPTGKRTIYAAGEASIDVFDMADLVPGQTIEGAAIIESATTTVLLRDGDRARLNPGGWIDIDIDIA